MQHNKAIKEIEAKIQRERERLKGMKGNEWFEQVRIINNLSVDLELKKRQRQTFKSTAIFKDELTVSLPRNNQ
jgi:phage replication-related protein YjqB (UPF0714/DUF867 family)